MTRRKWTTTDQEEWLKSNIAGFGEAQVNKTTSKEFFPAVFKRWRSAWPTPSPTPEEITEAGNVEKATQKKRAEEDGRIRAWFHNHTRVTSGNGARGLLKLKPKQKTLQEWQVYHGITYENQWKAVIDEEWEKYKSAWEAENPGKEPDETRFTFMTSFMRKKYLEESEEVQDIVRKRREELKEQLEAEGEGEENSLVYQDAINRLPRTLAVWGESVRKQTGWNITFLVGGPAPRQNGKIMSYMLHCGKSPKGWDFEEFLGVDGYDEHIIAPFDDFLHEAFPPEVCNSRSLGSKVNTPEADTTNLNGISDNRDIVDGETGLGFQSGSGLDDETDKATGKKAKKGKKGKKKATAPIRTSGTSTSTATNSENTATTRPSSDELTINTNSSAPVVAVSTTGTSTNGATLATASESLTQAVVDDSASREPPESAPASSVVIAPTPSPNILSSETALIASSTATIPPVSTLSTLTTNDLSPMHIDAPASKSAKEPTSSQDPMEVDQEKAHMSSSTIPAVVTAPAWLTALSMDKYFQECSNEKAWQALVQSLYRFEEVNTIYGNLPTTSRPKEVASWIKNKIKNSPPDVDDEKFGSSFMAWWIALQPKWRLAEDGSFNYEAPKDEDWLVLHKGGKAGLYTIVVALSWWVRVLTPEIPSPRAWTAVHDVQWVIDQISVKLAPAGKKRPIEDSADAPSGRSKRSRRG